MIKQIKKLLAQCNLEELSQIETYLDELIKKAEATAAQLSDGNGRMQRRELRIETKIRAKITRITDIAEGESNEYSATIKDISRHGMLIEVQDPSFIPSRIIKVTFWGPKGSAKETHLEILRISKESSKESSWFILGCRSISDEAVRRLRTQEEQRRAKLQAEQMAQKKYRMMDKSNILILIIGPYNRENTAARDSIQNKGYRVHQLTEITQINHKGVQLENVSLIIFCPETQVTENMPSLKTIRQDYPNIEFLAVAESPKDRIAIMKSGIDHCVMRQDSTEVFLEAIQRIIVLKDVKQQKITRIVLPRILIIHSQGKLDNLFQFHLESLNYRYQLVNSFEEATNLNKNDFNLVMANFHNDNLEEFHQICEYHYHIPVIALCEDLQQGNKAISCGASNYVCLPISKDNLVAILKTQAQTV